MNKEEKQPNVYMIPKNSFDTGYVFGGAFKTKNFIEGVVVAIPFLGIFIYGWTQLGWDVESTVAYAAIVCAGVFVAVSHGVGDDSFFEFLAHVIHFRKSRRISKYNPRIKTELEPDYLMKENGMLPKEKLKEAWENFKKKVLGGGDGPISADITADDLQIYYDDDEDFVEKPDELKTKAELKANVINCNPVTNESTLHHSDGWLYKNANCIFYYFSSTQMLYVFHRVNAALYATELLDAGYKLKQEKRPFPRAAENHEKGRPLTKYYGIGLLLPAEQMLYSERMQGHMWKWRVEQDKTGHFRFIPVKTRKFVKNL